MIEQGKIVMLKLKVRVRGVGWVRGVGRETDRQTEMNPDVSEFVFCSIFWLFLNVEKSVCPL